jgi:leader peptidase (prepilin peptidase)/N-methyltransferase
LAITTPRWAVVVVAGLFGVTIGSFLNVVVYRTPRRLSIIRPPSFCPSCKTPVGALDNVPVLSWLVLRGRCRSCSAPISPRYPLVEGGTGVLFALVAAATGPHWSVAGLCALAATLAADAVIELDGERPPAAVAGVGTALGVLGLVAAAAAESHWTKLVGAACGTAVATGLALLLCRYRWTRATGPVSVGRAAWALPAAGAVLGWSGPVGAAAGAGVLCVLLVLALSRDRPGAVGRLDRTVAGVSGPAAAALLAAVLGVVAAVAAGASLA